MFLLFQGLMALSQFFSRNHYVLLKVIQRPQKVRLRSTTAVLADTGIESGKPYDEVPGPKPLPLLGNTWRMLPLIGMSLATNIYSS